MEDNTVDSYHKHEALDRMFVTMETFNSYILDHPYICSTPHLLAQAEKLSEEMMKLYQNIGRSCL